jgi:septum formation protein
VSVVPRVVLASQSPRRRQLLELIGVAHEVVPADIDETWRNGESPEAHAERLAREKAALVSARHRDALTVGADTIVVVDGEILGKPIDANDARRMLRRLSGRGHIVHTAVAVARADALASSVETVHVVFRKLIEDDIEAYIATGEPMDKAGAYGIQGYGATLVTRIEGDYFAVMGLALGLMVRLFGELGIRYDFGTLRAAGA